MNCTESLKEERVMMKIKKQNIGKSAEVKKGESTDLSMTYHLIMMILKFALVFRTFWNLVSTFMNEYSVYRTVDQAFYILMIIVIAVSIWKHEHKIGVYTVLGFGIIDLIFQIAVLFTANIQNITLSDMWLQYLWLGVIALWEIATILYYRKRWSILK